MKALEVIKTEGLKGFIERWKSGIQQITPEQSTKQQIIFTWITIVGIICGIVVSLYYYKFSWWITIILIGALGNSWVQLMALKQKYKLLVSFGEIEVKGGQEKWDLKK